MNIFLGKQSERFTSYCRRKTGHYASLSTEPNAQGTIFKNLNVNQYIAEWNGNNTFKLVRTKQQTLKTVYVTSVDGPSGYDPKEDLTDLIVGEPVEGIESATVKIIDPWRSVDQTISEDLRNQAFTLMLRNNYTASLNMYDKLAIFNKLSGSGYVYALMYDPDIVIPVEYSVQYKVQDFQETDETLIWTYLDTVEKTYKTFTLYKNF